MCHNVGLLKRRKTNLMFLAEGAEANRCMQCPEQELGLTRMLLAGRAVAVGNPSE